MKILKFILSLFLTILISCEERNSEPKLILIKASNDQFEHFDTIYGRDISRTDSIMFWYDNDNFKGSIDTLLILKDQTKLMGKTLEFIREKTFDSQGKKSRIKKYYYHGDGFHGFNIFYIDPMKGIIINTTHNDMIIEYDFIQNRFLIEKIKNDSLFFGYE